MSKNDFYKNSFMLTASNLTTGLLGFIFSMYLSKVLGPEGMGLYGIIMPIYNLFISIMTAGIIASISKITAVYSARDDYKNIIRTMKVVAIFNFIWCLIIGIFVFFLSPIIGHFWAKDPRIIKSIMVTCPAMIFIALSNILKGFFYGTSKITVPSFIDILEKSLRIFVLAILIFIFKAETLESLVTLAYLALCLGELQSLILLFGYFKYSMSKFPKTNAKGESRAQLLFDVLVTSVPLCLNGFLMSIFSVISTLLVPKRLIVAGFTYSQALSLIGKYSSMAMSIVTFPDVYKRQVYIYVDKTGRLAATTEVDKYLDEIEEPKMGTEVSGIVYGYQTNGSLRVAIDNKHRAVVLKNEYFTNIKPGDNIKGKIIKVYEDGIVGLSLRNHKLKERNELGDTILNYLKENGGVMSLNDKSTPDEIRNTFKTSKNYFKMALGGLMKKGLIEQDEFGTRLK